MGKRTKPARKSSSARSKKPLLVRVKILNASEKENVKVRGIIDEGLSDEFRRIDVQYE
jgi:hypothetical protein